MPTPTDNNGPTFESWRSRLYQSEPRPLSDADIDALYRRYLANFPDTFTAYAPIPVTGQKKTEGDDMRRKQSDGTWTVNNRPCLDRTSTPITAGVCIYRTEDNPTWCAGRLLGVGKENMWRVRDRFTRKVVLVWSESIISRTHIMRVMDGDGFGTRFNSRSLARYIRHHIGHYNQWCDRLYARYWRRAQSVLAEERISWLECHFGSPYERVIPVSLEGAPLESTQGYMSVPNTALPDGVAPMRSGSWVQYFTRENDPRYTECRLCDGLRLAVRMNNVVWREPGHNQRYTSLCADCINSLSYNRAYHSAASDVPSSVVVSAMPEGYVIQVTPGRVTLRNVAAVQPYHTRVEQALDWIGTGPFHLGMEIEGFTMEPGKLCQALYKGKLAVGKSDSSIRPDGDAAGVEVVTTPIASDPAIYRKAITKLARILETFEFGSNKSCGGHIHISASAIPKGAIARLRYAIAKYPQGWSLIFGRDFNGYCAADGAYRRSNQRTGNSMRDERANILDALAIGGRGAIVPNTGHNTHEFRAFASRHTLATMLASFETVMAMREWVLSMPSDYTLASYLKFMHAPEGADTYSKRLAHDRKKVSSDPFDQIAETLTPKDAPELAYARAMAVSALVRIRMARVKANRPTSTSSKPKAAPVWTLLDEAKKRVQAWRDGQIEQRSVLYINPGPLWSTIYWRDHGALSPGLVVAAEFRDTRLSYGGVDLVIREQDREAWNAPFNGGSHPQTPAKNKNLPPEVLTLAI
jgi:hypothetical protein